MFLTTLNLFPVLLLLSVLYGPVRQNPSLSVLLPEGTKLHGKNARAVVITAHPDDEAMFFGPVILGLLDQGVEVWGLCMSTGNADGLGETRRSELLASYNHLGVPTPQIRFVDHPDLQDGPTIWDAKLLAQEVSEFLYENPMDLLITFDTLGISSHPNHLSLPSLLPHLPSPPKSYLLRTPFLKTKYLGPVPTLIRRFGGVFNRWSEELLRQSLEYNQYPELHETSRGILSELEKTGGEGEGAIVFAVDGKGWRRVVEAMMEHWSQMVWFRWGYVVGSRLMWEGELVAYEAAGAGGGVGDAGGGRDEL